jgi:hypothetical protein
VKQLEVTASPQSSMVFGPYLLLGPTPTVTVRPSDGGSSLDALAVSWPSSRDFGSGKERERPQRLSNE